MIDAHCHLTDARLSGQLQAVLARMDDANITGALVIGSDLASSRQAVALARACPVLRATVGVHPHESSGLDQTALESLAELARAPEVVAWGEIGLDFYYDHSPRDVQRDAFRRQLHVAADLALPIIIHEREAVAEVMAMLDEEDGWSLGGAWHCCSTAPELAVAIAERLFIGIAGWITFPKAENIRCLASAVPLERLLLETDSPYLTPVPHRGKLNEPAYLRLTAQALAGIKGVECAEVERLTDANVRSAFPRWHRGENS